MGKPILPVSAAVMLVLACGPEQDDAPDAPGELVYEQLYNRVYRLDRRIDASFESPGADDDWKCGLLTDRAYDELEATIEALDPSADYGEHRPDCNTHGALVHIEGFEHSPFDCTHECCHRDLVWAAFVYTMILTNFDGGYPTFDGEPYVAIDPDQPCP
jgi:hypothetical protein